MGLFLIVTKEMSAFDQMFQRSRRCKERTVLVFERLNEYRALVKEVKKFALKKTGSKGSYKYRVFIESLRQADELLQSIISQSSRAVLCYPACHTREEEVEDLLAIGGTESDGEDEEGNEDGISEFIIGVVEEEGEDEDFVPCEEEEEEEEDGDQEETNVMEYIRNKAREKGGDVQKVMFTQEEVRDMIEAWGEKGYETDAMDEEY